MTVKVPDILDRIRGLVALPSVSSGNPVFDQGNLAVIHLLAEWLDELGFAVSILDVSPGKAN